MSRTGLLIILMVSILFFPFCSKKKTACADFKEGKFLIINNKQEIVTEINRTKNFQLEKDMETGFIDSVRIEWLSNCTFTLQDISQQGSSKLTVEITNIEGKTADIRATYPGVETKPVLKMKKIE